MSIELDASADMATALSNARYVVGCESYGLVVALNARRKVYCSLPPHPPACRLPHDGIVHLGLPRRPHEKLQTLPATGYQAKIEALAGKAMPSTKKTSFRHTRE